MLVRALLATLGLATLAVSGALVIGNDEDPELRTELAALELRVASLEQRTARLERGRESDAARAMAVQQAIAGLTDASQRLSRGDEDIGEALEFAEAVRSPNAGFSIRAARTALANKDLGLAQQYVLQALFEARQSGGSM